MTMLAVPACTQDICHDMAIHALLAMCLSAIAAVKHLNFHAAHAGCLSTPGTKVVLVGVESLVRVELLTSPQIPADSPRKEEVFSDKYTSTRKEVAAVEDFRSRFVRF